MNTSILVLLCVNLALLVAVLLLILLRAQAGSEGSTSRSLGPELRTEFSALRSELGQSIGTGQQQLDARMQVTAQASAQTLTSFRESVEARLEGFRAANDTQLELVRATVGEKLQGTLKLSLDENAKRVQALTDTHTVKQTELQASLRTEIEKLQHTQREELEKLRETLRAELEVLRHGNEAKLEKMRETVDEKLQGTLERRLGESFKLVSERLELVQKGLGEMQTLASDVGGLKRVLTNVKSRGSWGEVQLARQLEDMLTQEQYAENVAVQPGSAERVEFAIKLPGRGDGDVPVWLPIDSKFPREDYERLVEAQEHGDKESIDAAGRTVERVILTQAKLISSKYIHPPHTTDFAIMYLPTEGLFAEAIRRPGLASRLQNEYRITISGPTVLMSLLNSLQLGFRTLAIEQRSSEVWKVLGAAKAEFQKYGQVWDKLEKQLATAQRTVQSASVRTRAVERTLRDVEVLDSASTPLAGADEEALPFDPSESSDPSESKGSASVED